MPGPIPGARVMRSPGKVAVRRRLVSSCVLPACVVLLWQAAPVAAQPVAAGQPAFPVRPVRMINPFSGGGGIELGLQGRAIGLDQPFRA